VRITASLGGVIPSGDEEDADSGVANPDRLLRDAADRPDAPVEVDLAGRRDPAAVVDVLAESLEEVESEGETRGRPADVAGVDRDLERQLDRGRGRDEDADDRALRVVR